MKRVRQPIPDDVRQEVLKRDGHRCRYCGSSSPVFHMDHVYPESKGGETSVENLVTACPSCNTKKQAKVGLWPKPIGYFNDDKDVFLKSYFRKIALVMVIEIFFLACIPYLLWQATITQDEAIKQLLLMAFVGAGAFGVCAWIMSTQIKS